MLQSKENNAGHVCHGKWGDGSCLGSMSDVTLPGSLGTVVHGDHYRGHYREKTAAPVMML
jgi:hypothetical protein